MNDDVFDNHDGVVNHESYRGSQAAQSHEVEALTEQLEGDEGHCNRDWNHQPRHD